MRGFFLDEPSQRLFPLLHQVAAAVEEQQIRVLALAHIIHHRVRFARRGQVEPLAKKVDGGAEVEHLSVFIDVRPSYHIMWTSSTKSDTVPNHRT